MTLQQRSVYQERKMNAQLSFFEQAAQFATPYAKGAIKAAGKDPLAVSKVKFSAVADEQLKLIKAAADKGFWFKKLGEGYVITLKNGAKSLNAKQPSFAVGSAADAVKFIEGAKAASAAGQFDELFLSTQRKARKPKEAAAANDAAADVPAVETAPATPQKAPALRGRGNK